MNIFRFLIWFSSFIFINTIYIPNSEKLNTFGIKSLDWQENSYIQMHHNYSKVNQFNSNQQKNVDLKINNKLEDFSQDNQVYKSCPKDATGSFIYEDSCSQFLNCWKGRGFVQNCAPGTLFNPKTLECDYQEKVECVLNNRFSRQILINTLHQNQIKQPRCPQGFSGLIPHYEICSKYIQCNRGNEIVMECPAGTNFDSKSNRCDFPYKSECFNEGANQKKKKKVVVRKYFDDGGFEFDGVRNDLGISGVDSRGKKYFVGGVKVNDHLGEFQNQNLHYNLNQNQNQHHNLNQNQNVHQNLNQNQYQNQNLHHNLNHKINQNTNQNHNFNQNLNQRHNLNQDQNLLNQNQNMHHNLNQDQNLLNQNQNMYHNLNQDQNLLNQNQNMHQNLDQNQYQSQNLHHNLNQNQNVHQKLDQNQYHNQNLHHNLNQNQIVHHNVNQNQNLHQNLGQNEYQNQNQHHNFNQNLNQNQNYHHQNQNQYQNVNRVVKCPDGQSGLFPHPYDCQKFLNCDHGRTFIQECGPGTVFNPKIKVCDWPYNVQCNQNQRNDDQRTGKLIGNDQNQLEIQTVYGIDSDTFCLARNGFFENFRNCSVFFNCKNGKFSIGICHKGAQFNPKTNDCDDFYRCAGQGNRGNFNYLDLNQKLSQNWNQNENLGQNLNQNRNFDQKLSQNWNQNENFGQNLNQNQNFDQNLNQNQNFDQNLNQNQNFDQKLSQNWNQNENWNQNLNQNQNLDQKLSQNWNQNENLNQNQNLDQKLSQNWNQNIDQNQINYEDESTSSKSILTTDTNADYIFEIDDLVEVPPSDHIIIKKIKDCSLDDSNCSKNLLNEFKKIEKSKMAIKEISKYSNTSLNFCAKKCLEENHQNNPNKKSNSKCKSFNYRKNDGMCFILDTNLGETGSLFILPNYDYYEYKNFSMDCAEKFICSNRKCIEKHKMCDGKFDCVDKEDEKNCDREKIGYSIQLIGSNKTNEGAVHVKAFNKVGFVCDDQFGLKDADVVCKEIGFEGALEIKSNGFYTIPDEYKDDGYLMDDVQCSGNETSLKDCDFNGWGNHNCRAKEIVGVVCKSSEEFDCPLDKWKCETSKECIPLDFLCDNVDDCSDNSDEAAQYCESPTEIRLSNGNRPSQGRLEIKYHGTWGTVCDDDFNDDAAKVVCRYLGFKGSATSHKNGVYGPGKGPIWLDQVFCQGNETTLQECDRWDWGKHNCDHSEDVGIDCDDHENVKSTPRNSQNYRIKPLKQILPITCGLRSDNIFSVQDDVHFRVVKGLVAEKGMYPWQASVRVKGQSSQEHWCGAVIVSEKFVLTAGHCLNGYQKGGFVIVAGDYDRNENEGTEQVVNIEEFYVHNEFRKGTKMNNDLALIKLKGDGFRFDDHIRAICLPPIHLQEEGLNCSISGFGSVKSGRAVASRELRAGFIPIQSREVCKMPHIYGEALTEGMICAGNLGGGVDACDGDSGGPLACLNDGVFTLVGLTSWGQHCGHANKPGVYVKISHYRNWLDEMMRKHSD
ncbi:uncharacterized protein [Onthophagus taurus]|uniref:uncharacterized protein isoform X2 n=1 Tax=Onthophagus taurus TaxID=166361 RepID=UPI0039BE5F13